MSRIINIKTNPQQKPAITLTHLKELIERFEKTYPNAVLCLNERDQCLDIYSITNNGGDTEYCAQILWE